MQGITHLDLRPLQSSGIGPELKDSQLVNLNQCLPVLACFHGSCARGRQSESAVHECHAWAPTQRCPAIPPVQSLPARPQSFWLSEKSLCVRLVKPWVLLSNDIEVNLSATLSCNGYSRDEWLTRNSTTERSLSVFDPQGPTLPDLIQFNVAQLLALINSASRISSHSRGFKKGNLRYCSSSGLRELGTDGRVTLHFQVAEENYLMKMTVQQA